MKLVFFHTDSTGEEIERFAESIELPDASLPKSVRQYLAAVASGKRHNLCMAIGIELPKRKGDTE